MDDLTARDHVAAIKRRLVEIARAIARKPRIILMDEGAGIQGLIVDYFMDLIVKIAEYRVDVLDRGVIRFGGLPAEVKVNARVPHDPYPAGKFDRV